MYPNLSLEDATIAAWYADFRDEEAGSFEKALREARLSGGDFFPSPAAVSSQLNKIKPQKTVQHDYSREAREAQFRSDWAQGIVWIVEHKESHKVITKELKKYVDSGIWDGQKLRKFMTNDGVISYHFGEFLP